MNESGRGAGDAAHGPGEQGPAESGGAASGASPGLSAPAASSAAGEAGSAELVRDNDRGLITGVCAGLGSYTGVDPIVWRVGFAITGLAGFTGVLLYVGAWMAIRDSGRGPAMFEQLLNRRIADRAVPTLLGLGLAAAVALSLIGGVGWGTLVLATPLILGALVAHNRGVDLRRTYRELPGLLKSDEPPPTTPEPEPKPAYYNPAQPWAQAPAGPVDLAVVAAPDRTGGADAAAQSAPDEDDTDEAGAAREAHDAYGGDGGSGGRPPAPPCSAGERRRERRRERRSARGVRLLGIVAWAVVAAAAITIAVSSAPPLAALFGPSTGPYFLGSVVVMIGVAAVVGTWLGDPRGLIIAGAVAVVLLVASAAVDLSNLHVASPSWRPTTVSAAEGTYRLTGGQARLDLTRVPLEPGQRVEVGAEVGVGSLTVLVPADSRVQVRSRASFGEIRIDETVRWGTGLDVRRTLEPERAAADSARSGARQGGGPEPDGGQQRSGDGEAAAGEPPTLVLDLVSRIGDLGVRRASS